ncbi:MAG TPA: 6-carboxyhexanoate--CoA ligase [Nitrospirota bacterium]|nr:6-carboxyhexanoate--CoA ligase [Nitrospirota bacterium]
MRSSLNEGHLSGAERIVNGNVVQVIPELMHQAISSCKMPDRIIFSVDAIDLSSVIYTTPLHIRTIDSLSPEDAEKAAADILKNIDVSPAAIESAFRLLRTGPAPGGKNMRGAVIMDSASGERMEPDSSRGIRVSRVDYTSDARHSLSNRLMKDGGAFHRRILDALAIATKVADRRETVAELCWSDDPEYTIGYVATRNNGYMRITNMKKQGNPLGGRVFFVNRQGLNLGEYIHYMEKQPVIIDRMGK